MHAAKVALPLTTEMVLHRVECIGNVAPASTSFAVTFRNGFGKNDYVRCAHFGRWFACVYALQRRWRRRERMPLYPARLYAPCVRAARCIMQFNALRFRIQAAILFRFPRESSRYLMIKDNNETTNPMLSRDYWRRRKKEINAKPIFANCINAFCARPSAARKLCRDKTA